MKSSMFRGRVQAAAKQVRRFSNGVDDNVSLPSGARVLGWLSPSRLQERADAAAKHMRYFRLFCERGSIRELGTSVRRAGFMIIHENAFEVELQWEATLDKPDFTYRISYDPFEPASVTAESCQRDIVGIVMMSVAGEPTIVVEMKQSLEEMRTGRNAVRLRRLLLSLPDFDDGIERFFRRLSLESHSSPQDLFSP